VPERQHNYMAVRELSAMTWEDVAGLDAARIVAILPVGATEAHGPHLPLGTDVVIAEAMARAGAARLAERGIEPLILPPIAFTPVPFAAAFPGTIGISPETLTATVRDLAASLGARGVRMLVLANAHLDPTHLRALHAATSDAPGSARVVFPDITRRPWGARLTDEFRSGACHAGQYETSIVLAVRPDLVSDARTALPAITSSLSVAMREGKSTFHEAGGDRAYFGAPAAASAEEGRATIDVLGAIIEEAVLQVMENA
jgi:creatinine amidohydrolase